MINRYMSHIKQSIIKKSVKTFLAAVALSGVFNTTLQAGKEVYEELTTQNNVVDLDYNFFSITLRNKDDRTPEQLITDVKNRVLNLESLEKVYVSETALTVKEKKQIINSLVNEMAYEANLNINNVIYYDEGSNEKTAGFYLGFYLKGVVVASNSIYVNKSLLEENVDFRDTISTVIHEMFHAIEFGNIMKNHTITELDKKMFSVNNLIHYQQKYYDSSFIEAGPTLISNHISNALSYKYDKFAMRHVNESNDDISIILKEIYLNLYDEYRPNNIGFSFSLSLKYPELSDMPKDTKGYMQLTISDLILEGMKDKLNKLKVSYSEDELKDTYYYKTLASFAGKQLFETRYIDFFNNVNYQIGDKFFKNYVDYFNANLQELDDEQLVRSLALYLNNLRYYQESFSLENQKILCNIIEEHISKVSAEHLEIMGMQDYEEVLNKANQMIQAQNSIETKTDANNQAINEDEVELNR